MAKGDKREEIIAKNRSNTGPGGGKFLRKREKWFTITGKTVDLLKGYIF